ncbi:hypothetical protein BP6252_10169 [Coleophoma cylindrospora]|uniref:Intradiol ring-cleavage dioxygenases domain-containing protein n=1 Tax=Coleophoma cylindrospora TaxID=1849047 RepID=A0A3D8QYB3_9HELO|nr:hypothetical protein BP6252_10169 [Coleophoma cylindrospora]
MRFSATAVATILSISSLVAAHPGHDHSKEIEARAAFMKTSKRDLSHCVAKRQARGVESRAVARRAATAKAARSKRGLDANAPFLKARDEATVLNTTHLSSVDYDLSTDESVLFASNSSCVLSPEVTQGPYYVSGEYVRANLTEDQEGVELHLDIDVTDVNTCEPVTGAVIEIWACNSTGVYSGIVANGNGDSSDTANIDKTFLRGLQPVDSDGVAQFTTLFPGHYTSRANHFHVLVHQNGTQYANGTYGGGTVAHVGQLFFDQDLISLVEATAPYSTNTQELTLNSADSVLSSEAASSDPMIEYSLLGASVTDGILGWISFAVDTSNEFNLTPAASLYASGGVEN